MKIEFFENMKIDPRGYIVYKYALGTLNVSSLCSDSFTINNTSRFFSRSPMGSFIVDVNPINESTAGSWETRFDRVNYARIDDKYCVFITGYERQSGTLYIFNYKMDYWHTYANDTMVLKNSLVSRFMKRDKSFTPLVTGTPVARGYSPTKDTTYTLRQFGTLENPVFYTCVGHLVDSHGRQYMVTPVNNGTPITYSEELFRNISAVNKIRKMVSGSLDRVLENVSCDKVYVVPKSVAYVGGEAGWSVSVPEGRLETTTIDVNVFSFENSLIFTQTLNIPVTANELYSKIITIGTPYHSIEFPFDNTGDTNVQFKFIYDTFGMSVQCRFNKQEVDVTDFFRFNSIYNESMRNASQAKLNATLGLVASTISFASGVAGGIIGDKYNQFVPQTIDPTISTEDQYRVSPKKFNFDAKGKPSDFTNSPNISWSEYQDIEHFGANRVPTYLERYNPAQEAQQRVDSINEYNRKRFESEKSKQTALAVVGAGVGIGRVSTDMVRLATAGLYNTYSSNVGELSPTEVISYFGLILWNITDSTNNDTYRNLYGYNTNCYFGSGTWSSFYSSKSLRVFQADCTILGYNADIALTLQNTLSEGVYICTSVSEMLTAYNNGSV